MQDEKCWLLKPLPGVQQCLSARTQFYLSCLEWFFPFLLSVHLSSSLLELFHWSQILQIKLETISHKKMESKPTSLEVRKISQNYFLQAPNHTCLNNISSISQDIKNHFDFHPEEKYKATQNSSNPAFIRNLKPIKANNFHLPPNKWFNNNFQPTLWTTVHLFKNLQPWI